MFRRREKPGLVDRLRQMVWPAMGWTRTWTYYRHRVSRISGTPYFIACGLASGAAISITPMIGFHFILAAVLAFILRGSIVAALVGTFFGNPWTFPAIWYGTFKIGSFILGGGGSVPATLTIEHIMHQPDSVFYPMLIGCVPPAIIVWMLIFFPARDMVEHYQRRRVRRLKSAGLKNRLVKGMKSRREQGAAAKPADDDGDGGEDGPAPAGRDDGRETDDTNMEDEDGDTGNRQRYG